MKIELIGDLRRHKYLSWPWLWCGTNIHDVEYRHVLDRVFWFVGVTGLVFSLNGLDESGCGLWATLVSNNREGMDERTRNVVEGSEGVVSGLGHDNNVVEWCRVELP